jgi:hypothetical protein
MKVFIIVFLPLVKRKLSASRRQYSKSYDFESGLVNGGVVVILLSIAIMTALINATRPALGLLRKLTQSNWARAPNPAIRAAAI